MIKKNNKMLNQIQIQKINLNIKINKIKNKIFRKI